jgi:hypothetical protein
LKDWPDKLLGKPLALNPGTIELLSDFNDVRGDLTHPKTQGYDVYERLSEVEPISVVDVVAEYIVRYHAAEGTTYPYWIFGWNYLNPRRDECAIIPIHDQQFSFSLQCLGFQVPAADAVKAEEWRKVYLGSFDGYQAIRASLDAIGQCEPKQVRFPYRPTLCRRWWTTEHHATCGRVTAAPNGAATA